MKPRQQQGRSQQRKARKSRKGNKASLVANRAFAPLLGLWGLALGALVVVVLPASMVDAATRGLMIGNLGLPVQPLLAGFAGVLIGGVLFMIAAFLGAAARRRAGEPSIVRRAAREMRPIDPVRDLGSRSLDEPIETMPFATPAWRDADIEDPAPKSLAAAVMRELDLSEFAELPGRNAVWVEEQVPAPEEPVAVSQLEPQPPVAEPAATEPRPVPQVAALRAVAALPDPGTAALTRLRSVPASELSLPQMVERFAGALHEHRTTPPARSLSAADLAAREAALAEALKALAAISAPVRDVTAPAGESDPLHAALAQLQLQRGAA
ncbi:hypothetical protein [Porphyrobacter sp. YT40]|uniref:hypothetical protein n=1 Tax=Porphyrobacter sp. YT40 TaxID=2547601 RepID=UPI0011438B34|nr:hypothetical protein [Porphyrobacter sp. YT40]QDH34682.1 hypothetical protein E2E27_10315 [Porphyrobacter sp. YT40]